jgi:hypothetical protein
VRLRCGGRAERKENAAFFCYPPGFKLLVSLVRIHQLNGALKSLWGYIRVSERKTTEEKKASSCEGAERAGNCIGAASVVRMADEFPGCFVFES